MCDGQDELRQGPAGQRDSTGQGLDVRVGRAFGEWGLGLQ